MLIWIATTTRRKLVQRGKLFDKKNLLCYPFYDIVYGSSLTPRSLDFTYLLDRMQQGCARGFNDVSHPESLFCAIWILCVQRSLMIRHSIFWPSFEAKEAPQTHRIRLPNHYRSTPTSGLGRTWLSQLCRIMETRMPMMSTNVVCYRRRIFRQIQKPLLQTQILPPPSTLQQHSATSGMAIIHQGHWSPNGLQRRSSTLFLIWASSSTQRSF